MARKGTALLAFVILTLVGCTGIDHEERSGVMREWPDVECPMGLGKTAEARLADIETWAGTGTPAYRKAQECRAHTGVNELHCTRLFSAWTAAEATRTPGLTEPQKQALWMLCVSELTHGPGGEGDMVETWPDVACPEGAPQTARMLLDEIALWAENDGNATAKARATACRDTHTGITEIHRIQVSTAYDAAKATQDPGITPEQKATLWVLCVSELTHGPGGGVPGGG